MKQLHFIVQAKGGVGKSMLTYLLGLAKDDDKNQSLFVDVDSSTQTSTRQLKFLGENRMETLSLLNDKEVLVRDNLVSYLESIVNLPFNNVFFDFGAPESEQVPALIDRDLPLKEFMEELGFNAHFHLVIGGGGAYKSSVDYMKKILKSLNGDFDVTIWKSITTFNNFQNLAEELSENCKKMNLPLRKFADFDPSSNLGSQILDGVRKGYSLSDYQTGARLRLKKELTENFKDEIQN
jgi:hypothetical protein